MFAWFASPQWQITGVAPELKLSDQRESRDIFTGAAIVSLVFGGLAVWGLFFQ
jgi:hypothetical protein